jgi:phosphoesterase RecJ-like protein
MLRSLVAEADTIVLCCHQNPDGDAMGAMLGWGAVMQHLGKEPLMVVPDMFPDYLQWLPNTEKVVRYDKRKDFVDTVLKIADLVFCLDFNSLSRTDAMEEALKNSPAKKVLIDHHPNPDVDTTLCFSRPEASSASELVLMTVIPSTLEMTGPSSLGSGAFSCAKRLQDIAGAMVRARLKRNVFVVIILNK